MFQESFGPLRAQEIEKWASSANIHDFSYPTLIAYKQLPKLLEQNKVTIEKDVLLLSPSPTRCTAYFSQMPSAELLERYLQRKYICLLPDKHPTAKNASKRTEVVYSLAEVFESTSYPNAKKRYQRIKYPFVMLEREKISIRKISGVDIEQAYQLHESWIGFKLLDERVHQHSLSTARYRRCIDAAIAYPQHIDIYGAFQAERLLAVRIFGRAFPRAFDLAYFSDYQNMASQLTEYLNTAFMKILLDEGFSTLNAGLSAEKGLKQFKDHFPNKKIYSYQYK